MGGSTHFSHRDSLGGVFMGYSWHTRGVFMGYTYVSGMCRVCIGYVSGMRRDIRCARRFLENNERQYRQFALAINVPASEKGGKSTMETMEIQLARRKIAEV